MGFLARLAVGIAASAAIASAQTYTSCDPLQKSCPDDPALSGKYFHNYATSKAAAPDFTGLNAGSIFYQNDGAHFRVGKRGDAPTLVSNFYFMYGRFEVKLKSAGGQGIVSSIVMQSDVRDEIDWELLGGRPTKAQTNYFGKGNTETYDRMIEVDMADNQASFHTYTIDWTAERVQWIIDGGVVRTLTPGDVKGDFYPQTPMQARIGNWAGGDPSNQPGTIEWAGGETDYDKGPFDMIIEHITVTDYSTGKFYRYTDNSGSAKSIVAVDGKIMGGDKNTNTRPPLEDKPDEPKGGNSALPTTSLRAPSNSGRVTSPTPTSTGSSDSDSDSGATDKPDPTAVVPEFNNPLNNVDTEKSTIVKQTATPSSPHGGAENNNNNGNNGGAGNDNGNSNDPDSAAPKAVSSFALVALGLISSVLFL